MPSEIITVNIEKGRPRAEEAKRMLLDYITMARRTGVKVIKVIHGYGSTGTGGVLRIEIRRMLAGMKARVTAIHGENFSIFDENTRQALAKYPELRRDRDLENANNGITLIIIH
jgi:hypothetical protein